MRRYLTFELFGPLASWGDVAVGQMRPSRHVPTRSALLGLLAAALGIRRHQESRQLALAQHLRVGALVWRPGTMLRDYHTAQVPTGKRARNQPSRRDELRIGGLTTILSSRDYLQDHLSVAIVPESSEAGEEFGLESLAQALRAPVFPLCLGRRSCPPAAPLNPTIHHVAGLATLVAAHRPAALSFLSMERRLEASRRGELWWDWPESEIAHEGEHHRWDDVVSRSRWQFRPRIVKQAWVDLPVLSDRPDATKAMTPGDFGPEEDTDVLQ